MTSDAVSLTDTASVADAAVATSRFCVKIVTRGEIAGCPAWAATFADRRKDHRYYEILEDTLRDRVSRSSTRLAASRPSSRFFFSTRTFSKDLARNGKRGWRASDASFPDFSKRGP